MGKYWWRARQAKREADTVAYKKNLTITLLVPIVLHTAFDYPLLKAVSLVDKGTVSSAAGVLIVAAAILIGIGSIVFILISARRTLNEESLKAAENNTDSKSIS